MGNFKTNMGFELDGNGNAEINYSKTTWGKTIQAKAIIRKPQGTFHVELYKGEDKLIDKIIKVGEQVSAEIKTDFRTKLKVKIHSDDVRNCGGSFQLEGSY